LLIAYLQACTALQAVAAGSQDVTYGLSIGTDISEQPNASSYVIVQKMGLNGFFRNVGACLSGYTALSSECRNVRQKQQGGGRPCMEWAL